MAIDADLGAGVISSEEAKVRDNIEKEADFYGAMDGASKFVKGCYRSNPNSYYKCSWRVNYRNYAI